MEKIFDKYIFSSTENGELELIYLTIYRYIWNVFKMQRWVQTNVHDELMRVIQFVCTNRRSFKKRTIHCLRISLRDHFNTPVYQWGFEYMYESRVNPEICSVHRAVQRLWKILHSTIWYDFTPYSYERGKVLPWWSFKYLEGHVSFQFNFVY